MSLDDEYAPVVCSEPALQYEVVGDASLVTQQQVLFVACWYSAAKGDFLALPSTTVKHAFP